MVVVSLPLTDSELGLADFRRGLVAATLIGMLVAAGLAVLIADRSATPVRRLTRLAERLAHGDLDVRLVTEARDEVGQLTETFNYMAEQLREKIATLDSERGRLSAIMDGMVDGVLIVDGEGMVRMANPSALRLLGGGSRAIAGASPVQAMRDHRLVAVWQRSRELGQMVTEEVELNRRRVCLRVIAAPHDVDGSAGSLIMLQDLTELRRLEMVRRDFVGNVSHELRTPLASLKALVETLREGALEDPPAAQRFLERMDVEVDALTQMVAELLELARIESGKVPLAA